MSTPRRPCPRSSAAPMIATGAFPFAPPTSASLVGVAEHAARLARQGEVAQSVEHTAENRGVAGSIPALATSARSIDRPADELRNRPEKEDVPAGAPAP